MIAFWGNTNGKVGLPFVGSVVVTTRWGFDMWLTYPFKFQMFNVWKNQYSRGIEMDISLRLVRFGISVGVLRRD